jgi:hypothetical protein
MAHKFNIGQIVELEPRMLRASTPGPYEIRHLVPASDRVPGDPCYRIKSIAEKYERVAPESELRLSKEVLLQAKLRGHDDGRASVSPAIKQERQIRHPMSASSFPQRRSKIGDVSKSSVPRWPPLNAVDEHKT